VLATGIEFALLLVHSLVLLDDPRDEDAKTMKISYDLEFDMDRFLNDLEKRQSARKRVRLEEIKKEARRLKHERKAHHDRADD
jgi:hypothetical protein